MNTYSKTGAALLSALLLFGCDDAPSRVKNYLENVTPTPTPTKTISGKWWHDIEEDRAISKITWDFQSDGTVSRSNFQQLGDAVLLDTYSVGKYTISGTAIDATFKETPQHESLSLEPNGDLIVLTTRQEGDTGIRLTPKRD